jgi:hypothetical protein
VFDVRFLDSPSGDSTTGGVLTEAVFIDPVPVGGAAEAEQERMPWLQDAPTAAEGAAEAEQERMPWLQDAPTAAEGAAEAEQERMQAVEEMAEEAAQDYDDYDDEYTEYTYDNLTAEGLGSDEIDW